MLSKKEAKEMSKYITLGVVHYDNIKDQTSYVMGVLEKYNLVEKTKRNEKVMGNHRKKERDLGIDVESIEVENTCLEL